MVNIAKKILTYGFLLMIGLSSVGCSHAIIKNRIGAEDGKTYEKIETMQPKTIKTITIKKAKTFTIKKINGKLVIVKEEETNE